MKKIKNALIMIILLVSFLFTACDSKTKDYLNQVKSLISKETSSDLFLFDNVDGHKVTYEFDDEDVISKDGKVTCQLDDTIVTVRFTIEIDGVEYTDSVKILVLKNDFSEYYKKLEDKFNAFNRAEYSEEEYAQIESLYNNYMNRIKSMVVIEQIEKEIEEFEINASKVRNAFDYSPLLEELDRLYLSFDKEKYSAENYNLITSYYNDAKSIIISSSEENALRALEEFELCAWGVEPEKTAIEKLLDIEEDLDNILSLSGKTINSDLNLKRNSLYNSEIIWLSSNESILSNSGVVGKDVVNTKISLSYKVILDGTTYDGIEIDIYVSTKTFLPSYYNALNINLRGIELKKALRDLITTTHKYRTSYNDLRTMTAKTDRDPNNSSNIILIYSRLSVKSTWDGGDTWNREHVWPQSKGWFSTSGAGSDIHHLRPADNSANSSRGNKPYGLIPNRESNKKLLQNKYLYGYSNSTYFEPLDEVKGDVARIIFYLLVRYSESDNYRITNVAQSMEMLLDWNVSDPVDNLEIRRNEEAYKIQGNRNPFIDYADFANEIFDSSYSGTYKK